MSALTVDRWIETRHDEVTVAGLFFNEMIKELTANAHKGDRPGWMTMTDEKALSEVFYHGAKLTYALHQHRQGDGPLHRVREFSADVANMAMMTADVAGCFELDEQRGLHIPPSVQALRDAEAESS